MKERIDKDALQREQAQLLRANGLGFKKIGEIIGTDREKARGFARSVEVKKENETLDIQMANGEACMFCGGKMEQHGGAGRPRRFCSDHCRRQYWRLHRDEQKKNPDIVFTRICRYCGQPFEIYGKNERKYCCRDHYLKHFYGEEMERKKAEKEIFLQRQIEELTRILAG